MFQPCAGAVENKPWVLGESCVLQFEIAPAILAVTFGSDCRTVPGLSQEEAGERR
jgi:hypothetical protein